MQASADEREILEFASEIRPGETIRRCQVPTPGFATSVFSLAFPDDLRRRFLVAIIEDLSAMNSRVAAVEVDNHERVAPRITLSDFREATNQYLLLEITARLLDPKGVEVEPEKDNSIAILARAIRDVTRPQEPEETADLVSLLSDPR